MWRTKIQAFTIIELVVALLLSGMLATLAYTGLRLWYKRHQAFLAEQEHVLELTLFAGSLSRDFRQALYVLPAEEGIRCITDSSQLTYRFREAYILRELQTRQGESQDTFHLAHMPAELLFEEPEPNMPALVEHLALEVAGVEAPFRMSKEYDRAAILNYSHHMTGKY